MKWTGEGGWRVGWLDVAETVDWDRGAYCSVVFQDSSMATTKPTTTKGAAKTSMPFLSHQQSTHTHTMRTATKASAGGKPAAGGKTTSSTSKDAKARNAKKAALVGVHATSHRKVRKSVSFHRPKTLRLPRSPKYLRKSIPHAPRMDEFRTIANPLNTEHAMKKIEENNTLVFLVDLKANKKQITDAMKKLYNVKVAKVNTLIRYVMPFLICGEAGADAFEKAGREEEGVCAADG